MIPITKRSEPSELLQYRKQKCSSYADMPGDVKLAVKRQLVGEQGSLCAYCMSQLPGMDRIAQSSGEVTIEHWLPQHPADGSDGHDPLDYRNMLGVCSGNRGSGDIRKMTCDAARGNKPLRVSPLKPETLADIYYTARGEIHSRDEAIDVDLVGRLNLNCEAASLPQRRKAALNSLQTEIRRRYPGRAVPRAALQKMLDNYESETTKKTPYVGILTAWLRKKLAR